MGGKAVHLKQQTEYPWNGDIMLTIDKNAAGEFALKVRIPGWVRGEVVPSDLYAFADGQQTTYSITVNGEKAGALTSDGYYSITRKWKKGDRVQIHFDMEARIVRAHKDVAADRGRVCVERGPLVYCAEHPDNHFNLHTVLLNQRPHLHLGETTIAGTMVKTLQTDAQILGYDSNGRLETADACLTLIPYYAWAHRGRGQMAVWLPQAPSAISLQQTESTKSQGNVFFNE